MASPQITSPPSPPYTPPPSTGLSCPECGSPNVSRSQRRDWEEKLQCWLRRVLPYRCRKCDLRFYGRKSSH